MNKSVTTGNIKEDLSQSMVDELGAATDYNGRAKLAREQGDEETAKLWEHIAEEEKGHFNEFSQRLKNLEAPMKTNAVKFLDEELGIIEGLGIPYGGPMEGKDLQREYFTKDTDFSSPFFDGKAIKAYIPSLYHHGMDPEIKDLPIGEVIGIEDRPEGKWFKVQLDKANKYYEAIKQLIQMGKLAFSSGAIPEGVAKAADGFIKRWPLKELSETYSPANPLAQIGSFKAVVSIENLTGEKMETKKTNDTVQSGMSNLPAVSMKPDPKIPAEVNGHKPGENKAPPEACQVKATIKCQVCGKDTSFPPDVVEKLQALGASVNNVLAQMGVSATSVPQTSADSQPQAPSQPPPGTQGMAPENHGDTPPTPPTQTGDAPVPPKGPVPPAGTKPEEKPEDKSEEKPGEKPGDPAEDKEPDSDEDDEKKPEIKSTNAAVKAVEDKFKGVIERLEGRIKTLEAMPLTAGPKAGKSVDNPKMGASESLSDDTAMERAWDKMANDTTLNWPTRQMAAQKAAELSIRRVKANGPQPLLNNR
jgi:rubrerythrin